MQQILPELIEDDVLGVVSSIVSLNTQCKKDTADKTVNEMGFK